MVVPGKPGEGVMPKKTIANMEAAAGQSGGGRVAQIVFGTAPPKLSYADARAMHITTRIATYMTYVSGTPGTDFGVGLFAMLAFWTAWRAVETKQGRWLILSGALSGLAAVSKTTGVFMAAALGAMLALAARATGYRHENQGDLGAGRRRLYRGPLPRTQERNWASGKLR